MRCENIPVFQQQQQVPAPALRGTVKSRSLSGLFQDLLTTLLTWAKLISHRSMHTHTDRHHTSITCTSHWKISWQVEVLVRRMSGSLCLLHRWECLLVKVKVLGKWERGGWASFSFPAPRIWTLIRLDWCTHFCAWNPIKPLYMLNITKHHLETLIIGRYLLRINTLIPVVHPLMFSCVSVKSQTHAHTETLFTHIHPVDVQVYLQGWAVTNPLWIQSHEMEINQPITHRQIYIFHSVLHASMTNQKSVTHTFIWYI